MDTFIENLIKIAMAVVVGGVIGAEREFQDKAAGFRTIILITIGSTLFTIFSMSMDPENSRSRVASVFWAQARLSVKVVASVG